MEYLHIARIEEQQRHVQKKKRLDQATRGSRIHLCESAKPQCPRVDLERGK